MSELITPPKEAFNWNIFKKIGTFSLGVFKLTESVDRLKEENKALKEENKLLSNRITELSESVHRHDELLIFIKDIILKKII